MKPPSRHDYTDVLFSDLPDGRKQCRLCPAKRKPSSNGGYSNTYNHLTDKHAEDYVTQYYILKPSVTKKTTTMDAFVEVVVDKEATSTYQWLDWIIMDHLPLSFCEKDRPRKYSGLETISTKTLCKRMDAVEDLVVEQIREALLAGKPYGLLFDAWTERLTHFVAVIAAVPDSADPLVSRKFLLCFTPFEEEECMHSDAFFQLLDYVLEHYRLEASKLCFVTCDHAKVNGAFASKACVPMIRCGSHRFQLAVNLILKPTDENDPNFEGRLLDKVNTLMRFLNTVKNRARLRRAGALMPLQRNATRWSSTFAMLDRYVAIKDKLDENDAALATLKPTPTEDIALKKILDTLKKLESISKRLRGDDSDPVKKATTRAVCLLGIRKMFDAVMRDYPDTKKYLARNAAIVHSPDFENAVVRVISGKEKKLSKSERDQLRRLERPQDAGTVDADPRLSYADRILMQNDKTTTAYMDLR